jgi:hypothetical protein
MITAERLREALDYDPKTGVFRWKILRGKARPGFIAGVVRDNGYRYIGLDGREYSAHRLAWLYVTDEWPKGDLDHRHGNRDFNAFSELRLATRTQNNGNARRRKSNRTGFKGVRKMCDTPRAKPFHARICVQGKTHDLGTFATAEEAHKAYVAAAQQFFGEFARAA